MSIIPHILLSLLDESESHLFAKTVSKYLPQTSIDTVDRAHLDETLVKNNYHFLILDYDSETQDTAHELIQHIAVNFPEVLVIPALPDDPHDEVRLPLAHNIFVYLSSPIKKDELRFALRQIELRVTQADRKREAQIPTPAFPGFIGQCSVMQQLFRLITRIADDEYSTVLIRGESGTGKELVARAIHSNSSRKNKNFVPVNCAAIPDDLLESELFGHMKGAFTGATQTKQGRIQYADGGTLFLDEIGDMKPALQAKLLRVLQEKEFEPVGSLKAVPVDTRILAATHCDLEKLVMEGQFREDLYYRLSVIPLEVPPLRERQTDIPLLLDSFVSTYTIERGREKIIFSPQSIAILSDYEWRGNVRELENLVQHMTILYSGKQIHPHHLPEKYTRHADLESIKNQQLHVTPSQISSALDCSQERAELLAPIPSAPYPSIDFDDGPVNFNELIQEFEKELILKAMRLTSGNKKEAARMLCLKRTTLLEKIKKKQLATLWESQ